MIVMKLKYSDDENEDVHIITMIRFMTCILLWWWEWWCVSMKTMRPMMMCLC